MTAQQDYGAVEVRVMFPDLANDPPMMPLSHAGVLPGDYAVDGLPPGTGGIFGADHATSARLTTFATTRGIAILFGANFCIGAFVYLLGLMDWIGFANLAMLLIALGGGIVGAVLLTWNRPLMALTPITWFLLACSAYFGFGPLLYFFGSESDVIFCDTFYAVDPQQLLRVNMLNSLAITIVMLAHALTLNRLQQYTPASPLPSAASQPIRALLLYAVVGILTKYGLSLPIEFQMISVSIPGIVHSASVFTSLAILLLVFLHFKKIYRLNLFTLGFICFDIFVTLLRFSKLEILVVFVMIVLGAHLARPSRALLIVAALAAPFLYYVSSKYVAAGREQQELTNDYGLDLRIKALIHFAWEGGIWEEPAIHHEESAWWARLNYAPAQTFAMSEYDRDSPGDTFMLAIYSLIPRSLWPGKPSMSPGGDFNYLVNGNQSSQSAPGIFAEAYWNGGWLLVVLTCTYVGALFAWFGSKSIECMTSLDFAWLPCLFQSILLGFRIDDWFASTYVASLVIIAVYYYVARKFLAGV